MHLRDIPSVSAVLDRIDWRSVQLPRQMVVETVRAQLASLRSSARNGRQLPTKKEITLKIVAEIDRLNRPGLSRVINGTGIVLHTGLGRAPISPKLAADVAREASTYTALEFDLETGKRGERLDHISALLTSLTGAEAALAVNNNAAALILALNTVADKKEVVISRGQLVEIGGTFRIPDVIEKSGAVMREVGTTNRTHLKDYEKGINSETAAILYAHTSNYRVEGFTKEVSVAELATVSKKRRTPLIVDLGSGALFDLGKFSLPSEPVVRDVINSGAGVVTFSGDKLLGGPQAGLVCGKKTLISKLHKNPIYRALRCDKITLALLEWTLRSYTDGSPNSTNLTHKLLITPRTVLRRRGQKLLASLPKTTVRKLGITVVDSMVEAGSGSLPVESIESIALRFNAKNVKPTELAKRFRTQDSPVVGYIKGNRFTIDLKAVLPAQMKDLSGAIQGVAK